MKYRTVFNYFCSYFVVIVTSIFIITLGQNITLRTSMAYSYYFNDSQAMDYVTTDKTVSEMSGEISGYLNSFSKDAFQSYEDTGYDLEAMFEEKESENMALYKHMLFVSLVVCVISGLLTFGCYYYMIKNNYKPALRKRYIITSILTVALIVIQSIICHSEKLVAFFALKFGFKELAANSTLSLLLGGEFIGTAGFLVTLVTVIILAFATYFTLLLTKPPKIFF